MLESNVTRLWRSVLWLLLLAVYMAAPLNELLPQGSLSAFSLLTFALAAGITVQVFLQHGVYFGKFHLWLTLFGMWYLLTSVWALDPDRVWPTLFIFARGWLVFVVTWQLAASRDHYGTLTDLTLLGMSAAILLSLFGFFDLLAVLRPDQGGKLSRFLIGGFNPNLFSVALASCMPLALYRFRAQRTAWRAPLYIGFLALAWFATILGGSRTGFVCALFATGAMLLAEWRRRPVLVVALITAGGILATLDVWHIPEQTMARLLGTASELETGTLSNRTEIWSAALALIPDNLWTGVGAGGFPHAIMPAYSKPVDAHNTLLLLLAETGVIGLTLYLAAAVAVFRTVLRCAWRGERLFLIAFFTLVLGSLTASFTMSQIIWNVLALIYGLGHRSLTETMRIQQQPETATRPSIDQRHPAPL